MLLVNKLSSPQVHFIECNQLGQLFSTLSSREGWDFLMVWPTFLQDCNLNGKGWTAGLVKTIEWPPEPAGKALLLNCHFQSAVPPQHISVGQGRVVKSREGWGWERPFSSGCTPWFYSSICRDHQLPLCLFGGMTSQQSLMDQVRIVVCP